MWWIHQGRNMNCVSPAPVIKMESSAAKRLPVCLFLALLLYWSCDAQDVQECCKQKTCPCRLYDLLRGSGNHAAGILTLGKRQNDEQRYQSRLYQLLHSSKNQAAGILTMGKRAEGDHSLPTHQEAFQSPPTGAPPLPSDFKPCSPVVALEIGANTMNDECCGPLIKLCLAKGVHPTLKYGPL